MARGNICSHTKNYVVKFGLRRETMKEIIQLTLTPSTSCYASEQHFSHTHSTNYVVKFGPGLVIYLPSETSSLTCEAFSISSKFDLSLVEGKQR